MPGEMYEYLARDHDRLEELLNRATARPGEIDMAPYAEFRKGLLRHIGIEEKIVMPAIAKANGGTPSPLASRIRLDHGAIAALLVPPPSPIVIATLRRILKIHDAIEEEAEGLYTQLEQAAGTDRTEWLRRMESAPAVAVMPYNEQPSVLLATRRAVERAGYAFES